MKDNRTKLPIKGIRRQPQSEVQYSSDFRDSLKELPFHQQRMVLLAITSLKYNVDFSGDYLFPDTDLGAVHARTNNAAYVLYQHFHRNGKPSKTIKIIHCGSFTNIPPSGRFDFE